MAKIYKYETPTFTLKFSPEGILTDYKHIVVSIVQRGITQIDKNEDELSIDSNNDTITLSLTQEETSQFDGSKYPSQAEIQVNIYYNDDNRSVSTRGSIDIYDNLYDKVITDE